MNFKAGFVQIHLTSAFKKLGFSIGKNPVPYCSLPLVVTVVLVVGFYWIHLVKDVEYLFCPINGRSLREREAVESIFPPSNYGRDMVAVTRLKQMATILLVPKDNLSVLRENIFDDAVQIDKVIYNLTVPWKNRTLSYKDVCMKSFRGECPTNDVLNLKGRMKSLRENRLYIKYPVDVDTVNLRVSLYVSGLGGVTLDDSKHIVDALAMRLIYVLDKTSVEKRQMSEKWEESFLDVVSKLEAKNVNIFRASGSSIDNELSKVTEISLPLIKIIILLMVPFAVISSMTSNCITSKPWVAVAACISPCLGVASAFGLLLMSGIPYIDYNIVILFLLVGIGLDDSFIMLSAWRRTDSKLKVEERLSEAYSEAAVSITITSLTNCLSLCIGIVCPYRTTRLFCIYTASSIIIAYIYQITFFGGILAVSGIREHKGLHSVLCFSIKEKKIRNSSALNLVCLGCSKVEKDEKHYESSRKSFFVKFFTILLTTGGKFVIMIIFLLYFLSSSYFLTFLREDFDFKNLFLYESYLVNYWNVHHKYFAKHNEPIHLVINETLDYSEKHVQKDIENILHLFAEIPNVEETVLSYSWLNYYLQQTKDKRFYFAYYGYNISDSNDFIAALRDVFLKFRNAEIFQENIKFNENRTKIISSRFFILNKNITSFTAAKRLISDIWKKTDSIPYTVYVHNIWFPLFNGFTEIIPSFITTVFSAVGLAIFFFFVIIPNPFCTVSILLTTVSIQIGVIGYMSAWDVPINPVSMVCTMISIGLSVDYAAHVSYAYLSCKEEDPNQKTISALRSAGYPVIQGCISTLLGAGVLAFGPSDMMLVFFKVITLVMLISLFHGIFVIPFILNSFEIVYSHIVNKFYKTNRHKNEIARNETSAYAK